MATTYQPSVHNYLRYEGATFSIGLTIPIAIPLTGLIVRMQIRDAGSDYLIISKSTTLGTVTVADQHIDIPFLPADTKGLPGTYKYEIDAVSTDGTYEQPLRIGEITIKKEYAK